MQPEIAAFGGGRLPPRAAQKHARTCKKLPVASFCASETAETGRIANGREQGDHVSRRQESFKVFCPTFCTLQKVGVAAERQKNLILFVRSCRLSELIRGLQNLESPFEKDLILFVRSCCSGALNRGLRNLESPCEGVRLYSFRLYEKNQKYPKGLRPSGLPGTIQSSVGEDFSKVFWRHEPNPAFRTKRRRKGFESVRRSGVTA